MVTQGASVPGRESPNTGLVTRAACEPVPLSAPGTIDEEDVIGYDALWDAADRCARGVRWKSSVASFMLNRAECVARLCDALHDGTYRPGEPRRFTVTRPKEREIVSIPFRDRVYQRSLNDVCVYPIMSRSWIYDNFACQRGKGTDFARDRLICHLQRLVREGGDRLWALKADVRKYYDSLEHWWVESLFEEALPDWAARRAVDVLRTQYPGDRGYNPGSQIVQIAGISALSPLDHMMKERMGARHYMRYMDDIVIPSDDPWYLADCLSGMRAHLGGIGLELHPAKTQTVDLGRSSLRFLGFDFTVTGERVRMRVTRESAKSMRRHVTNIALREAAGMADAGTARMSYEAWRSHAGKGDSERLVRDMDRWFDRLERDLLAGDEV